MPLQEEERLILITEDSTEHPQQELTETIDSENVTKSQGETPSKEIIGNMTKENVIEGPWIWKPSKQALGFAVQIQLLGILMAFNTLQDSKRLYQTAMPLLPKFWHKLKDYLFGT
jgi:hypothetical protein